MIKGFGWAETNLALRGPGLKAVRCCLEGCPDPHTSSDVEVSTVPLCLLANLYTYFHLNLLDNKLPTTILCRFLIVTFW